MRLGTNASGYRLVAGIFLGLAVMCALVVLDLEFGSSSIRGRGDIGSISIFSVASAAFAYLGFRAFGIRVDVSPEGVVVHNQVGPVRRIRRGDIRSIELRRKRGRYAAFHVIALVLRDGREVKCDALALGRADLPPDPSLLAAVQTLSAKLHLDTPD